MAKTVFCHAAFDSEIGKFRVQFQFEGETYQEIMNEDRYFEFCNQLNEKIAISNLEIDLRGNNAQFAYKQIVDYFVKVRNSYVLAKEKGKI